MPRKRADPVSAGTIAVVIPLYNKERWIGDTLQSVLAQSHQPDEIIVVDDGSTDGSPAIVSRLGGSRVQLLKSQVARSGPSAARNAGIRAAQSEWIALLDADDLWSPDYLRKVRECIGQHPDIGCVFSSRTMLGSARAFQHPPRTRGDAPTKLNLEGYLDLWIETGRAGLSPMCSSSAVIRADALRAAGLFPEGHNRVEDKDTWLRVIATADAVFLAEPLISYRLDLPGQLNQGPAPDLPPVIATATRMAQNDGLSQRVRRKLRLLASREAWLYGKRRRLRPFDARAIQACSPSDHPIRFMMLIGLYGVGLARSTWHKPG